MRNGKTFSRQDQVFYGMPENPVKKEDLVVKFKDCLSFSARPLPAGNIDRVIRMIDSLEAVDNVGDIMSLLVPLRRRR
jgi:hypothetical protein